MKKSFQYIAKRHSSNFKVESNFYWPNLKYAKLGYVDPRFPLPGNTGFEDVVAKKNHPQKLKIKPSNETDNYIINAFDSILNLKLPVEHQVISLLFAKGYAKQVDKLEMLKHFEAYRHIQLQFTVLNCPELLKNDFNKIFPYIAFKNQDDYSDIPLTAIIMTLVDKNVPKTKHYLKPPLRVKLPTSAMQRYCSIYMSFITSFLKMHGYWSDHIAKPNGQILKEYLNDVKSSQPDNFSEIKTDNSDNDKELHRTENDVQFTGNQSLSKPNKGMSFNSNIAGNLLLESLYQRSTLDVQRKSNCWVLNYNPSDFNLPNLNFPLSQNGSKSTHSTSSYQQGIIFTTAPLYSSTLRDALTKQLF